jgi:hypothetical protein
MKRGSLCCCCCCCFCCCITFACVSNLPPSPYDVSIQQPKETLEPWQMVVWLVQSIDALVVVVVSLVVVGVPSIGLIDWVLGFLSSPHWLSTHTSSLNVDFLSLMDWKCVNKRKHNLFFSFLFFYRSTRSGNHLPRCCYRTRSGRSQYVRSFQSSSTEIRPMSHGSLPTKVKFTFSLFLFRSRRIEILLYWWGNETKKGRKKKTHKKVE